MTEDIRDIFPPFPCPTCGAIMIKSKKTDGLTCQECGKEAALMFFTGQDQEKLKALAPIIMQFRMSTLEWMKAMEYAFGTEQYDKALNGIASFKTWLDEVATPMVEAVRQVKDGVSHGDKLPEFPDGELKMPRSGDLE